MSPIFANGVINGAFAAAVREGANTAKNNVYDATTNKFIDENVTHYDGAGSDTPTALPEETRNALIKVGRPKSGHGAFSKTLENGDTLVLENYLGPDGESFLAWNLGDGENLIIYTTDVDSFVKTNSHHSPPSRQMESSTLGSLLSHEIGHTSFGVGSVEILTTSIFENDYRTTYGLPLVDGYDKSNPMGVCLYEKRCQ